MTKRFVMIENNSGYVWGDANADSAIEAVRKMDADIGGELPSEYEELRTAPRDGNAGYSVYDATGADLPERYDGQDRSVIEMVSALPFVSYVRAAEDDPRSA